MSYQIGFIGLGVMGYPMAGHLANAGHQLQVFNRTASKAEQWVDEFGGITASAPRVAAEGADFVITCVGQDDDLRQICEGDDGILDALKPGAILIDHTTASAEIARELEAHCLERNAGFLDAPVSGGQIGAENGNLSVMVGGEDAVFSQAKDIFSCYSQAANLIGVCGSGQLTKMVNQICAAGVIQGLSEGLKFSQAAGLDGKKVIEVISKGAAQSWQMDHRAQTMLEDKFDFGFAVRWMRKDLDLVSQEAERIKTEIPITRSIEQYYREISELGGDLWDTSSLIKRL